MKIKIKAEKAPRLCLFIPTSLFLRYLVPWILPKMQENQASPICREQLIAFAHALKAFKKQHKQFPLVQVQSADGTQVNITL